MSIKGIYHHVIIPEVGGSRAGQLCGFFLRDLTPLMTHKGCCGPRQNRCPAGEEGRTDLRANISVLMYDICGRTDVDPVGISSVQSLSHVQLFVTLWTVATPGSSVHGDCPGKNTGVS